MNRVANLFSPKKARLRPTHKQNRLNYNKARPSHKKGQKKLDLVTKKPDLNTHTVTNHKKSEQRRLRYKKTKKARPNHKRPI